MRVVAALGGHGDVEQLTVEVGGVDLGAGAGAVRVELGAAVVAVVELQVELVLAHVVDLLQRSHCRERENTDLVFKNL